MPMAILVWPEYCCWWVNQASNSEQNSMDTIPLVPVVAAVEGGLDRWVILARLVPPLTIGSVVGQRLRRCTERK